MNLDEFVGLVRRWRVLDALREGPLDRRDLQERTDVSRATIHRQVRALKADGLIAKRNGEFALTPVGELAAAEFAELFSVMDTVSALSRVVEWLPIEEFDFEFARLREAEVTLPHRNDPVAPIRRMVRLLTRADRIRMVTYTFLPEGNAVTRRCVIEESQSFEGILDVNLVETILADPASAAHLRDLLVGGARIAVASEPVPIVLVVADETVLIGAVDGGGGPQGLIATDDEVVRTWAEETVDAYLDRADPIDPDRVGPQVPMADDAT